MSGFGDELSLLLSGVPQVAGKKNGDARFLSVFCSACNTEVVLDLQHDYGTPPQVDVVVEQP